MQKSITQHKSFKEKEKNTIVSSIPLLTNIFIDSLVDQIIDNKECIEEKP
jgi:hypothetical protein